MAFAEAVTIGLAADRHQITFPVFRSTRTIYADEVRHTAADRRSYRLAGLIVKHVSQDSHGYTAGLGVARDKRIERLDADVHRHIRVRKHHLSQRIGRSKRALTKPWQTVIGHRTAVAVFVTRQLNRPLDCPGCSLSVSRFDVQRKERPQRPPSYDRHKPFGRTVHNLPVAQVAPPA